MPRKESVNLTTATLNKPASKCSFTINADSQTNKVTFPLKFHTKLTKFSVNSSFT